MSDSSEKNPQLFDAISDRDATKIRQLILEMEFVLININHNLEDEDDVSTLTADVEDFDVIVAFTSEKLAGEFVESMDEIFDEAESVDGVVVTGDALLDYLPEELGLMVNPDDEAKGIIDPKLLSEVLTTKE